MNEIKVSIITTTYNHGKYIRQALDSLVSQKTNFDYEIIVHDDASTDDTPAIIKEYFVKYPHLIIPLFEKENQYSKGKDFSSRIFEVARGKYIAYCEGDDFWVNENKLQMQYDIMENNPKLSIVVGRVICCEENGNPSKQIYPPVECRLDKTQLLSKKDAAKIVFDKEYPFQSSCYFISKSSRKRLFEREFYRYLSCDQAIIREAIIEGDFFFINETLSCYRLNSLGGWNARMNTGAFEKKALHNLRRAYGQISFDVETKGELREIMYGFILKSLGRYGYVDKKMFNATRHYFKVKALDVLRITGVKNYLRYLLTIVSPLLVRKIYNTQLAKKQKQ